MPEEGFFREISHLEVPWGERTIPVPVFYRNSMSIDVLFLASSEKLKALLPSSRMHPIRIAPRRSILVVSVYEYKDCDIGAYNEISISIPFTLDRASPLFTGIIRKEPEEPFLYIRHLPVTTEIALSAGIDFAGYPKILASIEFEHDQNRTTCRAKAENQHILTLGGPLPETRFVPRSRAHVFTERNGRLLRSELILSDRQMATVKNPSNIRLEWGDHPIAQEIGKLDLGRTLVYQFTPEQQAILSPVIESYSVEAGVAR